MGKARDLASGQNGVRPFATASGVSASITGSATVLYPVGRFTESPSISTTIVSTNNTATGITVGVNNTSGFTAYLWVAGTASTNARQIWWMAVQQTTSPYVGGTAQ